MSKVHPNKIINKSELDDLCKALLNVDSDIQDIILFGSYNYNPSIARDIDLLITTAKKKPSDSYYSALESFPKNCDLIIREPNENINERIAWGIKTTGKVLSGNGKTLLEAMKTPMPTFERAKKILYRADENCNSAYNTTDEDIKDEAYRDAFNKLFDVARTAVMAYLGSDETRWGQLRRSLPKEFDERFRHIIDLLHIEYSYNGNYPKKDTDNEFKRCRSLVVKFVDDLEQKANI